MKEVYVRLPDQDQWAACLRVLPTMAMYPSGWWHDQSIWQLTSEEISESQITALRLIMGAVWSTADLIAQGYLNGKTRI